MAMGCIHYNRIRTCTDKHLDTLDGIRLHTHGSGHEKAALAVL